MKRKSLAGFAAGLCLVALAAGCAHGSGAAPQAGVRVVADARDVAGCEKLSEVRLTGTWTRGAAREELAGLVRSKGGNVLLLTGGAGSPNSGVAYRCAGGTSAASQ